MLDSTNEPIAITIACCVDINGPKGMTPLIDFSVYAMLQLGYCLKEGYINLSLYK